MEPILNANGRFEVTFTTELISHGSWGHRELGRYTSTMEFFPEYNMIEWDIPDLEETEHIGLEIEDKKVEGYDGIMDIPVQAIEFLEALGYNCEEIK